MFDTLKISEYIGLHYTTVSRVIKKYQVGRGKVILQDPPPGTPGIFQELYKITESKEDIFKNEI